MIVDLKSSKRRIFIRFNIKTGKLAYLKSLFFKTGKKLHFYTWHLESSVLNKTKLNRIIALMNYATIGAVINIEKFLEDLNIFYMVLLSFCFLSIICYVVYNLVGLVYQNKKLKNK